MTTCPTYLGLAGAFSSTRRTIVTVGTDAAGAEPSSIGRASRAPGTLVYLMSTGHNPTGTVMTTVRRQAIAAIADAGRATFIEDLSLADLALGASPPPPLAALSTRVVAIGSASKLLWGGLRIGWIRADEPLRAALIAQKAAASLATAAVDQALTAQLLAAIGADWLTAHRSALARRATDRTDTPSSCSPSPPAPACLMEQHPIEPDPACSSRPLPHQSLPGAA